MKLKYIFFLLLVLPFLHACSEDDDVLGIFTNHEWKLTGIFEEGETKNPYKGFWESEAAYQASVTLLNAGNTFRIRFNGIETNGVASGEFSGYATSVNIAGTWNANGGNNQTSINFSKNVSDNDVMGQQFIIGLENARSYDGDYNNLRIHYSSGAKDLYLLFRPVN